MLAKEILKSFGECLIALLVSVSIVFAIAVLWKPEEFINNTPLALAWGWQAIIITIITSAIFSLSKIWYKQKSRLAIQLATTVSVVVLLTIFTQLGNVLAPMPELLSLKSNELSEDEIEIDSFVEISGENIESLDATNDEVQELPDEL